MANAMVLCFGRHALLQSTRCAILKAAGHFVGRAATEVEFAKTFVGNDFDLVILCHTVPQDEKRRCAEIVRRHSPSVPVLALGVTEGEWHDYADATVMSDPALILSAIPQLLMKFAEFRRSGRHNSAAAGSGQGPYGSSPGESKR